MSENQICVQNVSYQYPNQENFALNKISLDVQAGEVLAIMGPTGAGKTTLVSLFNGLIPQFYEGQMTGKVSVNQLSTYEHKIQTLVEQVGLVLQDPETQIFGITVLEDTVFGPRNLAYPKDKVLALANQALRQVKLSGLEDRNTKNLSGGEKQRLAIAGVLAMQPANLVLDEPLSELDPLGRLEILDAIQRLKENNQTTVIFVEHNPECVLKLADRVAIIANGELIWLGKPKDLFIDVALTKSFSIRPPQIAEFGHLLFQEGLILQEEIPLTAHDAEVVVQNLVGEQPLELRPASALDTETNPKSEPIIEIIELRHQYPDGIEALKGIDCKIYPGELVAIIGQNGAGKSTLAKHFNGLLQPSSGTVLINGLDTQTSDIQSLARQVGYVFQNPDHQIFSATVEEELRFGLKNLGLPEKEQTKRIDEALAFVGLAEHRNRHPFTLGKGERQKVAVASILAIAPPIICIDEPTTGLDWHDSLKMLDLIVKLHQKGHTILMITHNMEIVLAYAQRALLLDKGHLQRADIPARIFSDKDLLAKTALIPPPLAELVSSLSGHTPPPPIKTPVDLVNVIQYTLAARA